MRYRAGMTRLLHFVHTNIVILSSNSSCDTFHHRHTELCTEDLLSCTCTIL
jgi:hypothetical protein